MEKCRYNKFCMNTKKDSTIPQCGSLPDLSKERIVVGAKQLRKALASGRAQHVFLAENADPDSIFYGKVNTQKIGAAGHSQGGRSAVNAAAADSRIDCVLSLAGSNFTSEAKKLSTPTFFIAGGADMMVMADLWVKPAYKNAKGPAVYANLKGAIHTTCCLNPDAYIDYILAWFDGWLKDDADALNTFRKGGDLSKDRDWKDFATKGF